MALVEGSIKKISKPIDYKILAIIFALTVGYQMSLYQVDPEEFNIPEMLYLAGILACAVASLIISKRYWGSDIFGRAYLFLGLGFVSMFIGDLGYVYYDHILGLDPYPSPFDIGFFASYAFASLHLFLNTRYFKRKWNIKMKALLVILPMLVVTVSTYTAYVEWGDYDELPFDLFYGALWSIGASITLSFAILGASVFRESNLGSVWLLLVIGIFIWMVSDVWYAYTEIFEDFDNTHPTNTLWMASFMIIIYALYKHQKTL